MRGFAFHWSFLNGFPWFCCGQVAINWRRPESFTVIMLAAVMMTSGVPCMENLDQIFKFVLIFESWEEYLDRHLRYWSKGLRPGRREGKSGAYTFNIFHFSHKHILVTWSILGKDPLKPFLMQTSLILFKCFWCVICRRTAADGHRACVSLSYRCVSIRIACTLGMRLHFISLQF